MIVFFFAATRRAWKSRTNEGSDNRSITRRSRAGGAGGARDAPNAVALISTFNFDCALLDDRLWALHHTASTYIVKIGDETQ